MKNKWNKVGTIIVDTGCCWIGDPCFMADEFSKMGTDKKLKYCVEVPTGYGDGKYSVYTRTDAESGRIAEAKVVFIQERL